VATPSAQRVRIIAGRFRGRVIRFPRVPGVRPTPDRVRETVFNWLGQDLTELSTLDLYAGSGALSLEALSRGAARAVAIERDPALARAIAATAETFGATGLEVATADAKSWLARETRRFDVIFLDPPFAEPVLPAVCRRIEAGGWLKPGGFVYLESPAAAGEPELPAGWSLLKAKKAGEVGYHLARRDPAEPAKD